MKITFSKFKNSEYLKSIEVSGHAGYARRGQDILCASISAITQSGALGILKVLGIKAHYETDEDKGYLKLELPQTLSEQELGETQIVFETMLVSLRDLHTGYSKYFQLEVK